MTVERAPDWAMEQAAALRSAVIWQSNASNEVIARALVAAHDRGVERQWRSIETAPKDGRAMMVWVANGETAPHCFSPVSITSDGMWWDDAMGEAIEPTRGATHWMPRPAPPAAIRKLMESSDEA